MLEIVLIAVVVLVVMFVAIHGAGTILGVIIAIAEEMARKRKRTPYNKRR